MDNQKKYNMEEAVDQMVNDSSAIEYGITIPVTIPSIGGYTIESLKRELTEFAMRLVMQPKTTQSEGKHYSQRLLHLKALSHKSITPEDVKTDERLAYLLNK